MRGVLRHGIVWLAAAALGAAPARYEVVAEAPAVIALPSPSALRAACGSAEVEGCTTLTLLRTECACVTSGGRWRMAVRVAFAPVMY
ncbi:MAG TPA: hypothetical protein VJZ76_19385, partial [Thermoanaerobaculia bacterium]|nr:hypothetical protein [Thermoanaerobaculia bacterium]